MALSDLQLLADFGLGRIPPERLRELGDRAEEHCFDSGDVRYCIIHKALVRLSNLWEEAETVPLDWIPQIDAVLESHLPLVLGTDQENGRRRAVVFLRDVRALTDRLTRPRR